MHYAQTKAYQELLRVQGRSGNVYKDKRIIKPDVLHPDLIYSFPHRDRDGLQLADTVPAAFFQAVNAFGPGEWDTQFAKMLRPVMATENRTFADYGVALQPTPPHRAKLTSKQKQIFQFYGYRF